MKKVTLLSAILLCFSVAKADYQSGYGLRWGERGIGLTTNYFIQPETFIQFDAIGVSSQEIKGGIIMGTFNIHKEIHASTLHTTQLSWNFGGGLHLGKYWDPDNTNNENHFAIGPDVRLGIAYELPGPFVIGAEVIGYYNVMPRLIVKDVPDG